MKCFRFFLYRLYKSIHFQLLWAGQKETSPSKFEVLTFPQSQSNVRSTMQTHPSIDAALLADWDLPRDYTPGLDLTFLVFFECKRAHHPTCGGLTPLLKRKRADPMLSDPNLFLFPLPLFISLATLLSPIHPSSGVGTYTCGSPQTSPPHPLSSLEMAFCDDSNT